MKALGYLVAFAISVSNPAHAQSQTEVFDGCALFSDLAGHIMSARQKRVPLKKALDAAVLAVEQHGLPTEPLVEMTLRAYERPVGDSDTERQQAVGDFADDAMLDCVNASN